MVKVVSTSGINSAYQNSEMYGWTHDIEREEYQAPTKPRKSRYKAVHLRGRTTLAQPKPPVVPLKPELVDLGQFTPKELT